LRKAREGKLLRNSRAHYGFKHDETGESYVVDEEEMRVVRRIFCAIAEGQTIYRVKRSLEIDGVAPPANGERGGKYWSAPYLRRVIDEDVYRPHSYAEVAELVTPEVAARLEESESYGIFWFNRTRTTRKRVSEAGPGGAGREYRWRYSARKNPYEQRIAIPIPHSGIPREIVDTARAMVRTNKPPGKSARRFWEIPRGSVRCGDCGMSMQQYAAAAGGRIYAYFKCSRLSRFGKDGCCSDRVRTNHRAEEIEGRVWEFVSNLMKDPEELRADLETMIEFEKRGAHGDPEREAKAWLDKLSEVETERRGYLRLAARGSIIDQELYEALAELEETRSTAEHELATLQNRQQAIEALERDRDAQLEHYAAIAPEALEALTPEERHHLYRMLRLEVIIRPDANLEVSGVFGEGMPVSNAELVSRYLA
jgi:Recombinase zinc beta ribbon domain/Recombinase